MPWRLLTNTAELLAVAYLAVLAILYLLQRRLLYLPGRPQRSRPSLAGLAERGAREVILTAADGLPLRSWYLPPPPNRPTIAYFHGNGGHIGHRAGRLERFADEGYGLLMLEYRGYGGNAGRPSEPGLYDDARAALAFLERQGIGASRRVLYGESLGSAVAVRMAAEATVGAVILESPFTSIAAVAQFHYPFVPARRLIWDKFDALSQVGGVRAPMLMLQGGCDGVVPTHFGQALFDAAPGPKERWLAPGGGHEDLALQGALDIVVDFLERHLR